MSAIVEKVKMKNQYILVKKILGEDPTKGKIVIPDQFKEVSQKGQICAIGEGGDSNLKLNDIVLYRLRANAKPPINLDGEKYIPMKEDQVLGVMFGEDACDVNPTKEHILLEWEFATEFYPGTTIRRPESHNEMHYTGIVKAIGPDVEEVALGDRVFFDQFCSPEKFVEDQKRYVMVKQGDVIAVGLEKRNEVAA